MGLVSLRFRDLEFNDYDWHRQEGITPVPEIPRHFENCAFYLYAKTPKGTKGPIASGVLVSITSDINAPTYGLDDLIPDYRPVRHVYAVTSAHVLPSGASLIRMSLFGGTPKTIELEPHEWEFLAGGHDIAAVDITEKFEPKENYVAVDDQIFLTEEFIERLLVNIGEDGFMIGLFADEPGRNRNAPLARFGNIAAMPREDNPIEQGHGTSHPSFLFDMRSRTGFSGSPVFIYRKGDYDMSYFTHGSVRPPTIKKKNHPFLRLLGVHSGQYPDRLPFHVEKSAIKEGKIEWNKKARLLVPSSVTIVAPAWEITKLLKLKKFADARKARDAKAQEEGPRIIPEVAEAVSESGNPSHKEDFTSLLNVAARTPPQDD
jgi:hypothetical protein